MFTEKSFAIYVLDDYSVHLMPQVPQALFKKGYVLVVIGGGITGNIQINDKNCHRVLKKHHQDLKMKLMLEQLVEGPIKIPSPSQNKTMHMLLQGWKTLEIDTKNEFKSPFETNALEGEEISLEEFQQECEEDEVTENDLSAVENNSEVVDATTVQSNNDQLNSTSIPKHHVSFSNLTNDPDIKRDSEFLDKMQQTMTNGNTSNLFILYLSQLRATYQKSGHKKKQIESKVPEKSTSEIDSHNIVEISTEGEVETVTAADSL